MPDSPEEVKPRPVGRPPGESVFGRSLSAWTPNDKAKLRQIWLSGYFPSKMAMAEAFGIQYDSLRHLAGDEGWPTDVELKREIVETATAAVVKLRETAIEEVLQESMASYKKVGQILNKAIESFEEGGALVAVDNKTGEKTYSKRRIKDIKDLVESVKTHHKIIGDLIGISELHKAKQEKNLSVRGNKIQLNVLTQNRK